MSAPQRGLQRSSSGQGQRRGRQINNKDKDKEDSPHRGGEARISTKSSVASSATPTHSAGGRPNKVEALLEFAAEVEARGSPRLSDPEEVELKLQKIAAAVCANTDLVLRLESEISKKITNNAHRLESQLKTKISAEAFQELKDAFQAFASEQNVQLNFKSLNSSVDTDLQSLDRSVEMVQIAELVRSKVDKTEFEALNDEIEARLQWHERQLAQLKDECQAGMRRLQECFPTNQVLPPQSHVGKGGSMRLSVASSVSNLVKEEASRAPLHQRTASLPVQPSQTSTTTAPYPRDVNASSTTRMSSMPTAMQLRTPRQDLEAFRNLMHMQAVPYSQPASARGLSPIRSLSPVKLQPTPAAAVCRMVSTSHLSSTSQAPDLQSIHTRSSSDQKDMRLLT
eukprot:gnl/TRDRNA2_/TRDRNA2_44313_c0_seq1.p1 gnl/TRDRNA2_/TRDRNA2_44313_c0~~gnl/TRDRNA2_/TRDRNA2_44313_c0_seq1.p1  ORF type:complete len:397 (-),score=67.84 gnl/TRDRNA2_/TRDRNA2_44313_c0_seq1:108-1298(-)